MKSLPTSARLLLLVSSACLAALLLIRYTSFPGVTSLGLTCSVWWGGTEADLDSAAFYGREVPDWAVKAAQWQAAKSAGPGTGGLVQGEAPYTLRWTKEAEELIVGKVERWQFPDDCEKESWLAVQMGEGDLVEAFHTFQAALVLGSVTGHTVVPIPNPNSKLFKGCPEDSKHLGCYFKVTKCSLAKDSGRMSSLKEQEPKSWVWLQDEGHSRDPIIRMEGSPGESKQFKDWVLSVWQELMQRGFVHKADRGLVEVTSHQQMEFMVLSILTKWMFNPKDHIKALAADLVSSQGGYVEPVLALQVDPWPAHRPNHQLHEYAAAVHLVQRARRRTFATAMVFSSVDTFTTEARGNRSVIGLPSSSKLLGMSPGGDQEQERLVASLYVAGEIADYSVTVHSSQLGRLLHEYIAATKRSEQMDPFGHLSASMDGLMLPWGHQLL